MIQLWHCQYGHLSFKGLKILQQKGMVHGLPQLESSLKLCKDCLVGKQQRDPFPKKSNWRASLILQLIHADICGPIKTISNRKKSICIISLTTLAENYGFIFWLKSLKPLLCSKETHVEKETNSFIRGFCTERG